MFNRFGDEFREDKDTSIMERIRDFYLEKGVVSNVGFAPENADKIVQMVGDACLTQGDSQNPVSPLQRL